ncbi:sensor histidine kinase [Xanthomonas campestris]|uniref:sensor histidine kinase n=1 Tax=Xanthomonas campestris TaxID=339 RepID=UPI0023793513|nr:sensor histidine kinase [Xanthomonas campestris]WDK58771.1 sensor histidine kinase [Xanthomonas campestris pv. campestris]WDK66363.1 sensor histidine kinase [Xanthomonas campestris pv. campestris]WDL43027.1 sensor histidine kinase [Xanthomonas campestris pv. campestris]WDL44644.1 sensor histidine kinase [Xanthomonas campestris pv. campestris]
MLSRRSFKVDARALLSLGRESIKDKTTALLELVKNAYDADATIVQVDFSSSGKDTDGVIRIADNGVGMTSVDIDTRWLRVGFSHKRAERRSAGGRRETGEKGVGRLSADRLGSILELRSKTRNKAPVGILVNWDSFDVDGRDIGQILVKNLKDPIFREPIKTTRSPGTEIIIRSLRQEWSQTDLDGLELELASLVNAGKVNDFSIRLRRPGELKYSTIKSSVQGNAELKFTGTFDSRGNLTYKITARPLPGSRKRRLIQGSSIEWVKINQRAGSKKYILGPLEVELSFYLRSGVALQDGLKMSQLREYLDTQGGVRVYRDLIRVKPYGDPDHSEGDWLGLAARKSANPAGAGREDFRINHNQLVGAVLIGRDTNPQLSDSAAREGLIHGNAYEQLRMATSWCVMLLESAYHETFSRNKAEREQGQRLGAPAAAKKMREAISVVVNELAKAKDATSLEDENRILRRSVEQMADISGSVDLVEREIFEMANQTTVYRGLATVGISSAVFGHETEGALTQAQLSLGLLQQLVADEPVVIEDILDELGKADRAVTRVQLWGGFALKRVKRDKRRRLKVLLADLVSGMLDEVGPIFKASGITLKKGVVDESSMKAFPMDVEAVVLNLLTNAYHAAGLSKAKTVLVELKINSERSKSVLSVSDSGPGIIKDIEKQIWSPLFSTKPGTKGKSAGTGLGLSIVKSICDEMGASINVIPNGSLGGATFQVAMPITSKE